MTAGHACLSGGVLSTEGGLLHLPRARIRVRVQNVFFFALGSKRPRRRPDIPSVRLVHSCILHPVWLLEEGGHTTADLRLRLRVRLLKAALLIWGGRAVDTIDRCTLPWPFGRYVPLRHSADSGACARKFNMPWVSKNTYCEIQRDLIDTYHTGASLLMVQPDSRPSFVF